MTDPYDLRARAVYDDHKYTSRNRHYRRPPKAETPPKRPIVTPNRQLLDDFMSRPETACHIPMPDLCLLGSTRGSMYRLIRLYGLPLAIHSNEDTLTLHINKEELK